MSHPSTASQPSSAHTRASESYSPLRHCFFLPGCGVARGTDQGSGFCPIEDDICLFGFEVPEDDPNCVKSGMQLVDCPYLEEVAPSVWQPTQRCIDPCFLDGYYQYCADMIGTDYARPEPYSKQQTKGHNSQTSDHGPLSRNVRSKAVWASPMECGPKW